MKFCILVVCVAFVGVANALDESEWTNYKNKHGKVYDNKQEDTMRMNLYAQKKAHVERHNAQNSASYQAGLNHLSDWTEAELQRLNGFKAPMKKAPNSPRAKRFLSRLLGNRATVPAELDWRSVPGRVLEVKNQYECGACWAFATTGLLEGQEMIRKNSTADSVVSLSEQNLVDCSEKNFACGGGTMKDALDFIQNQGGIDDTKSYPYEALGLQCRFKKDKVVFTDKGGIYLPQGDEEKLKQVVAKYGPVAVAIDASDPEFQTYASGVYYSQVCGPEPKDLNHAVLVVGYGTDSTKGDYWIVKNSWGLEYGDKGYIKMARNKKNNCGIATAATIATF